MSASEVPTIAGLGGIPQSLFSTGVAFIVITWVAVSLRVFVRGLLIKSFGYDDWTIIVTMAAFTTQCAFMVRMAEIEMDPGNNNNLKGLAILTTDTIAFSGSYAITCVFLKISLGLFFLRIIVEPWQRVVIYVCMGVSTAYGLTYFGLITFSCGDPKNYLVNTVENKCLSVTGYTIPASYAHTALNALVDWIYALLPIPSLWNLSLPRAPKIWAYLLLTLGAVGSVVSLVRFRYVEGLKPGHDFFKDSAKFAILSTIEPGLGIAAVSLATLRPLFRQCLETARSVSGGSRTSSSRKRSSTVPEIQLKGLNPRSHERDGFVHFGASDSTGSWTEISSDAEKGRKDLH